MDFRVLSKYFEDVYFSGSVEIECVSWLKGTLECGMQNGKTNKNNDLVNAAIVQDDMNTTR